MTDCTHRRILHIVPALFGKDDGIVGGAERFALELARHTANRVPTRLVTFGNKAHFERFGQLDVQILRATCFVRGQRTNPFSISLVREVARACVIHCHQQHVVASSFAAAIGRCLRKPVFVTDAGGGGWDISSYVSTNSWYRGHLHISEFSRKVAGHAEWERAHVIYGGVDTEVFKPGCDARSRKEVLFVGRLMAHKGVNDLIEAMPPQVPLRILGQPYQATFTDYLKRLATEKCVQFIHDCDDQKLVNNYQSALCIVLPSVYKNVNGESSRVPELLGQTLLEGMACGIPAICTNVGGMPEVVEDGVTGFVIPPNNPNALRSRIEWLLANPVEQERMGLAARQHVLKRFSWSRVVDRCLDVYGLLD